MNIIIFQLNKEMDHYRNYLFEPWERIEENFDFNNYKYVWSGTLEELGIDTPSTNMIWNLDEIFTKFNISKPKDFIGHSLSVSDIVYIDDSYYYCDSFGWTKINI